MIAGKQRRVIHPNSGRIIIKFPRRKPAVAPPMCMKLSTSGISPNAKLMAPKKMTATSDGVRRGYSFQLIRIDDIVAPSKPMDAPDAPTETRPWTKRADKTLPANPLVIYVKVTWWVLECFGSNDIASNWAGRRRIAGLSGDLMTSILLHMTALANSSWVQQRDAREKPSFRRWKPSGTEKAQNAVQIHWEMVRKCSKS